MAWRSGLTKSLQELRIHLSQTSPASAGVREFVLGNYAELKQANPAFPILVREAAGAEAKLIARYDFGVEKVVPIDGLTPPDIITKIQELIKHGKTLPRSGE